MRIGRLIVALCLLALFVPESAADWTASGRALYRDREFDTTGFTGVEPLLPVRFADIEVLDAVTSTILATGVTDASGDFSLLVVDSEVRDVFVRFLARSDSTADLFLTATTGAGAPYAVASPTVSGHDPGTSIDWGALVAEIGQGGEGFNLFDMGLLGIDYLAALQGSRPGANDALAIVWETARGQSGSFATSSSIQMRDSGGYDDTVVLHEFAHFAVFNYSDSDSPGGFHALADCLQDPRLAWDEGHASFFGNSILRCA